MDLWIRSQNKLDLIPNPKLSIEPSGVLYYITDKFNEKVILGKYYSKERALEILNEIQQLLRDNVAMCDDNGYATLLENIKIYEMPED